MYQRILVATDGSTLSKKAVASAIELAKALGAELVALKVIARYPTSYFEGSIAMSPQDIARARALLVDATWQHGRSTAGTQAAQAKNNTQLPPDGPAATGIRALVLAALDRSPLFFSAALPHRVGGEVGLQRVTQLVLAGLERPLR